MTDETKSVPAQSPASPASDTELLPCPFCGSPAHKGSGFSPLESVTYAYCSNNNCALHDVDLGFTPGTWNMRDSSAQSTGWPSREVVAREIRRAMLDNPTDDSFNKRAEKREIIANEAADVILARFAAALSGNAGAADAMKVKEALTLADALDEMAKFPNTNFHYQEHVGLVKKTSEFLRTIVPSPAALDPVTVEALENRWRREASKHFGASNDDDCAAGSEEWCLHRESGRIYNRCADEIRALLAQSAPSGNAQEAVSSTKRPDPVVHDERFPSERSVTHTERHGSEE